MPLGVNLGTGCANNSNGQLQDFLKLAVLEKLPT